VTSRAAALLVLAAACTNDVTVGAPLRRVLDVPPDPPAALDVLFVVDPAAGSAAARASLIAAAGDAVFGTLTDRLGRLPDLRVGVISSEVASGGLPAGCDAADSGALTTCASVTGHYLIDTPNSDGSRLRNYSGTIGDAVACLADVPPSACAVSQPITAVLAALGPEAPAGNADFLRDRAMLLVVFVAPRDDCSAQSPAFYDTTGEVMSPLDGRCFAAATTCDGGDCAVRDDGGLISIAGAADALRRIKKSDPTMLMVAGVFAPPGPVQLVDRGAGDVVPASACAGVEAAPGFRLAALAGEFSSRYAFASMCGNDPAAELHRITGAVADVMSGDHCVLGPLPPRVPCRAYAATDAARTPIPACGDTIGGNCFTIAPADACAGTDSGLAASPTSAPPGAHFVVECASPDGL
jgi:hypothetical protein